MSLPNVVHFSETVRPSHQILVLNAAPADVNGRCVIGIVCGEDIVDQHQLPSRGAAEKMAPHVAHLLQSAQISGKGPDAIVVVRGPGSFTGVRASLALAEGLVAGFGCKLHGVTVGACQRVMLRDPSMWSVSEARRDRVYVESPDGSVWAGAPETVVLPDGAHITGDAVSMLPQRILDGVKVSKDPCAILPINVVARAGLMVPPQRVVTPLYVDPPEAKPPAAGFRPSPIA